MKKAAVKLDLSAGSVILDPCNPASFMYSMPCLHGGAALIRIEWDARLCRVSNFNGATVIMISSEVDA